MDRRYKRIEIWDAIETEENILSGTLDEQLLQHFNEAADKVSRIRPDELDNTCDLVLARARTAAAAAEK